MRNYSTAAVMKEYLEPQEEGLFNKILTGISKRIPVTLEIKLPQRLYLKGELIAETISEEIEKKFSQSDLVVLLTEELLKYYYLHTNPIKMHRTFLEISSSFIVTRYHNSSLVPVKVSLSKKLIFKLEMLLADIEEFEGTIDLTVEQLLELQYMNFMADILQGSNEEAIQKIIKRFK